MLTPEAFSILHFRYMYHSSDKMLLFHLMYRENNHLEQYELDIV